MPQTEGSGNQITFRVSYTDTVSGTINFSYETVDGNALAGTDYTKINATAGQLTGASPTLDITVDLLGPVAGWAPDRFFYVRIFNADQPIARTNGMGLITDSITPAPTVAIATKGVPDPAEQGVNATQAFRVSLSGGTTTHDVLVPFATRGGTATISAGDTFVDISIDILTTGATAVETYFVDIGTPTTAGASLTVTNATGQGDIRQQNYLFPPQNLVASTGTAPGDIDLTWQRGEYLGILDGLATRPIAAYEFFRLTSTYNGPHVRFKETAGLTEMDFRLPDGATDYNLISDTTGQTVLEWLTATGATGAALVRFYDQIGNIDWVPPADASAPVYIDSGFWVLPSLECDGINDVIAASGLAPSFSGDDAAMTVVHTLQVTRTPPNSVQFALEGASGAWMQARSMSSGVWRINRRADDLTGSFLDSTEAPDNIPRIHSLRYAGGRITWAIDGTPLTNMNDAVLTTNTCTFDTLALGNRADLAAPMQGYFTGAIIWDAGISDEDEAQVRDGLAAYYGL